MSLHPLACQGGTPWQRCPELAVVCLEMPLPVTWHQAPAFVYLCLRCVVARTVPAAVTLRPLEVT